MSYEAQLTRRQQPRPPKSPVPGRRGLWSQLSRVVDPHGIRCRPSEQAGGARAARPPTSRSKAGPTFRKDHQIHRTLARSRLWARTKSRINWRQRERRWGIATPSSTRPLRKASRPATLLVFSPSSTERRVRGTLGRGLRRQRNRSNSAETTSGGRYFATMSSCSRARIFQETFLRT